MPDGDLEAHLFVVIGGTGDLMRRKLLPARYHLMKVDHGGNCCHLLAVARDTEMNDRTFRKWAREAIEDAGLLENDEASPWCDECLHYHALGREADVEAYRGLSDRIQAIEKEHNLPGNRVFYLATPPTGLPAVIEGLGEVGLATGPGWTRVVVEKPFGHDLASAQHLNSLLHRYFEEAQVYRIDHYLGKDTVQNLLVFRFANPIFESVWNRERVASVNITVAESDGVGTRGEYYEQSGALRDMVQNHLTQLLALTAMEVPPAFDADAIRDEKAKVLRSVEPISSGDVVFGQYTKGTIDNTEVCAYRDEVGVAPDSSTETFTAIRMQIANWRWEGVPFYLCTGKRLPRRVTRIVINFRCPPLSFFRPFASCKMQPNALVITLQPDEGFDLSFEVKSPGEPFAVQTQRLHFRYPEAFGPLPDAYETLLREIIKGDGTLFVRADETQLAWKLYAPILEERRPVHPYVAGTWGPAEADTLMWSSGMAALTE